MKSLLLVSALLMAGCAPQTSNPEVPPSDKPSEAQATLDRLDTRLPVPLTPTMAAHQKQQMRDHLSAVQEISAGLADEDFPAIEKASARIGWSESMGMMCRHMGAGAPGFTELALRFHHTADTIGEAAKKQDRKGVSRALATTVSLCISCHSTFRQQVVDDAAWEKLTSQEAPSGEGSEGSSK